MRDTACRLLAVGAILLLFVPVWKASAHLDAQRASLSQLFLSADVVVIARIDKVAERRFVLNEASTSEQVVSARILDIYKGSAPQFVDFFQDGHGHAHYVVGDTALLFLETFTTNADYAEIGSAAGVELVSRQVRNTEHRIQPGELPDYDWILSTYATLGGSTGISAEDRARQLKEILLRMLGSSSAELVESGLLDWEHAGNHIELTTGELAELLALTRDPARPVNLRLATLRTMYRKQLVSDSAWVYLFQHEPDDNITSVIRSTEGYESTMFMPYLIGLLNNRTDMIVEAAARALGHPAYAGAEVALESLLQRQSQRLNYAAVYGLVGLNSDKARGILLDAETNHPNPKVRRIISARMNTVGISPAGQSASSQS